MKPLAKLGCTLFLKKPSYNLTPMPELPEVEVIRQSLSSSIINNVISQVLIRNHHFRLPIPEDLALKITGQTIRAIQRRGKYLIFSLDSGALICHLGMSGTLQFTATWVPLRKHDHVALTFNDKMQLRLHDPRRFGIFIWHPDDPLLHPLLKSLGVEPLTQACNAQTLATAAQKKTLKIKTFLMDAKIIVGVGNIYANEVLFATKIHPARPANTVTLAQWENICIAIKRILTTAIAHGGTTLRDYAHSDGNPGHFQQQLQAYGRGGKNCHNCNNVLEEIRITQRTTVFCPRCQPYTN